MPTLSVITDADHERLRELNVLLKMFDVMDRIAIGVVDRNRIGDRLASLLVNWFDVRSDKPFHVTMTNDGTRTVVWFTTIEPVEEMVHKTIKNKQEEQGVIN